MMGIPHLPGTLLSSKLGLVLNKAQKDAFAIKCQVHFNLFIGIYVLSKLFMNQKRKAYFYRFTNTFINFKLIIIVK